MRARAGVETVSFDDCGDGVEVVEYFIDDMGHVWPGGINRLPARLVGKPSDKINATDVIWNFFKAHPREQLAASRIAYEFRARCGLLIAEEHDYGDRQDPLRHRDPPNQRAG